jgi:hypothetical protein
VKADSRGIDERVEPISCVSTRAQQHQSQRVKVFRVRVADRSVARVERMLVEKWQRRCSGQTTDVVEDANPAFICQAGKGR